jgi:hypothetical protein
MIIDRADTTTIMTEQPLVEYVYWYCEKHDDVYRVRLKRADETHIEPEGNPCHGDERHAPRDPSRRCYWSRIGTRTFDTDGALVHDGTQSFRFEMRAGRYKREYLDRCGTITLE